jgi:hypothetical protein
MTGRNFATAEEARGGMNVDINQKTQRRVGVRKRTATCWELRRWDAAKKGYVSLGHFKSQQEAEAAQADQAAPKTPRTKHTTGTAPSLPFAPFPRMTLTVLLCALHFLLRSIFAPAWAQHDPHGEEHLQPVRVQRPRAHRPSACGLQRAEGASDREARAPQRVRFRVATPCLTARRAQQQRQLAAAAQAAAARTAHDADGPLGGYSADAAGLARSRCMRRGLRERAARALRFSGGLPMACQLYTILHLVCAMYIARGWRPDPPQHL